MNWLLFLPFLAASGAAAATGSLFQPGEWYERLDKPSWTPPKWAFPVVWTTLYIASSYAATRVAMLPGAGMAMAFWAMQIAFNTLWSPVFFGLRRMGASLIVMAGLWIAVAGTTVTFLAADLIAGLLFLPYLVWVTVAGALNYSVYARNPGVQPASLAG
ncbi:sensory protein TspO [Rhodobacterales bacterium HKCCE3408]|nr:sensory protein TspO [Rhodobacterales bacterium HKCCE3408]